MSNTAGTLLKERYRLVSLASQRGIVAMYRAEDTQLGNRLVSVKGINQPDLSPEDVREVARQFQQEAHLLAGLNHLCLPHLYDSFQEAGHPYLVLDGIAGDTLETLFHQTPGERLPLEDVVQIGLQLAGVLGYLHTRQPPIIISTLQPAMILCFPTERLSSGDVRSIRLLLPGPMEMTMTSSSAGYAAPEQRGANLLDSRSDIYSLGAILYQALTGNVPLPNTALRWRGAPHQIAALPGLKVLIGQMVQPQINKRPVNMTEVKQRLQASAADLATKQHSRLPEDIFAPPQNRPALPRATRPITRRVLVVGLAGLVLAGGTAATLALARNHPSLFTIPGISPDLFTYRGHSDHVHSVAWSPNGQRITSGSDDNTVQVWNGTDGGNVLTYRGHSNGVNAVAWSPDGQYIASGSDDETVQVWEATTGKTLVTYRGHAASVESVTWSPDGTHLASSDYQIIHVWKVSDGRTVYSQMSSHTDGNGVAWSPDGRRIAASGLGWTLEMWDATDGSHVVNYRSEGGVSTPSWSPDSTHIVVGNSAVGNGGGTAQIWDASTGNPIFTYRGHTSNVDVVAWSPDGARIASGGFDQTVQVWNASNGGHAFTYHGHTADVDAIAWSPNSTYIASGSYDATVQVWKPG